MPDFNFCDLPIFYCLFENLRNIILKIKFNLFFFSKKSQLFYVSTAFFKRAVVLTPLLKLLEDFFPPKYIVRPPITEGGL
ncbi:MAG: hypothetical protein A2W05_08320 [Candidatus Schekmanbacteria bacterium RBG_16_38_10]|uniref:Uncharacterized protein n=1 Tax=Candidatus Schekmanbacteria bacterium RBG_16_38_10 TaxID=1817879 RepID=A0A1F7RYU3_9BACT|nr:MAG: hypothetical protein A2W05_08320 [Candidatus Schekmanbacteria bacterium RBG_16_38_10]